MRRPEWADWKVIVLAVACVASLGALATLLYLPPPGNGLPPSSSGPATQLVVIDGAEFVVDYQTTNVSDTNYFDSPECQECPLNQSPSTRWTYDIVMSDNDTIAHQISQITLSAPFVLVSAQPATPIDFAPGASQTIQLTIELPSTPGHYFIEGTIETT